MNIDIKKWNPWNWFRNEEEREGQSVSLARKSQSWKDAPSLYSHPLSGLHQEIDRLFDKVFHGFNGVLPNLLSGAVLKPSLDIKETMKAYQITVEVPGIDEKDVTLELCDGVLTISGEKKQEKEDVNDNWHRVERSYGSFKRMLTLPQDVSTNDIEAKFKNGLLTVTVPRKQVEKPKEDRKIIDIKRAA